MPRIYQRTKDNPHYLLPHVYKSVLSDVQGYEATRAEYYALISYSPPAHDGMPKSRTLLRPTEGKAAKVVGEKFRVLHAVEVAFETIPASMRLGIYSWLIHHTPYDTGRYDLDLWRKYEALYLYVVALKLNKIVEQ